MLFDRTADHLIASKVLLPGASVLWRLVAAVRERANERGWMMVASRLTDSERERLLALLLAASESSPLERLRRGPVKPTADGVLDALSRLHELQVLAPRLDRGAAVRAGASADRGRPHPPRRRHPGSR